MLSNTIPVTERRNENLSQILDEADTLMTELEKECKETGSAWPIKYTEKTVASVINLSLFGYRFDKVASS